MIRASLRRLLPNVRWLLRNALLLLLLTALPLAAAEAPEIRAGSELDFRPYCFTDQNGQPAGFGVELLQTVADKMGLRLRTTPAPWDTVWNELVAGQLDVLPVVARTPGREPLVAFSLPHTETFDAFFVQQGRPPIKNIAAAAGKEIVVLRSDAAHHQLVERRFTGKVIPVESIPDGLRLIASGQHDAMLCSKLVGVLERERAGIKGVETGPVIPDYKRTFSFAVRKGNAELVEKLNQGLLIVKADGTYDRIYRRWLTVADPWQKWVPYFQWIVAALVVLSGLVAMLQWMVRRRTRALARASKALEAELAKRRQAEDALRQLNTTLEERVAARTGELSASRARTEQMAEELRQLNEQLEERVAQRTAEVARQAMVVAAERQRFSDALNQLPAYLILLDPDYRVPFANHFFEERFGKSGGRRCYEYLFQRTEPCEVCETYKVLKTGQRHHWEWTGPDGRNYDIHDFPFTDVDGSPLIMEVGIDITEVKKAQAALEQLNQALEQRVAERTAELSESNQELEEFNRTMVGRELRMIELKQEINAVCAQLNQPPRYPIDAEEEPK